MIADISTNIPSLMVWTMTACRYVAATLVEHAAVNRRVVGSSPTWGATKRYSFEYLFFICFRPILLFYAACMIFIEHCIFV